MPRRSPLAQLPPLPFLFDGDPPEEADRDEDDDVDLQARMFSGLSALLLDRGPSGAEPDWDRHPFQLPPSGEWSIWVMQAGRGSGKTRGASEFVIDEILAGRARVIGLVAPTAADARDVMTEGPAGLLQVSERRGVKANYYPSKRRIVWPDYRASATLFSAEEPRRLRGPQHDLVWAEEVAAWQDAWQGDVEETTWNNMLLGLRLGAHARMVVTTTPKPNRLMKEIAERAKRFPDQVVMTYGTTYANRDHLSRNFFHTIISRYEGTRLGRQEIGGELLEDVEGALWKREWIDQHRILLGDWYPYWRAAFSREAPPPPLRLPSNLALPTPDMAEEEEEEPYVVPLPELVKLVVAIDPNTTSNPGADEAGIVAAALGADGRGYVLDDRSTFAGPTEWARLAIDLYYAWLADKIVAERNNGGEMVKITLYQVDEGPKVELVWASRGKTTRAEPAAALYEQGKISHVGEFKELEDQMTSWLAGSDQSPGRMDALVWALTDLFGLSAKGIDQQDRRLVVF